MGCHTPELIAVVERSLQSAPPSVRETLRAELLLEPEERVEQALFARLHGALVSPLQRRAHVLEYRTHYHRVNSQAAHPRRRDDR